MPDPILVNSMFARIARRYDVANRLLSAGMDVRWRRRLVEAVQRRQPRVVLDLATGSGDVVFALNRSLSSATEIVGMDFCEPMLAVAEKKKSGGTPGEFDRLHFRRGDALALPLADATCDAVTIAFGLRNLSDRASGLREMRRVLRPGGSLFVLEFSQPKSFFRAFYFFYLRRVLPRIAGWITGDRAAYEYLNATIDAFPGPSEISREIEAAGFSRVQFSTMTFGVVSLHEGTVLGTVLEAPSQAPLSRDTRLSAE
jgi:demethylmenaquinone methyltransferase / 2-methoxy-6-polyprenyl-1,4-benzoquinol methylase